MIVFSKRSGCPEFAGWRSDRHIRSGGSGRKRLKLSIYTPMG